MPMYEKYREEEKKTRKYYVINLDKTRIIWLTAITFLVFASLFLSGYWIGISIISTTTTTQPKQIVIIKKKIVNVPMRPTTTTIVIKNEDNQLKISKSEEEEELEIIKSTPTTISKRRIQTKQIKPKTIKTQKRHKKRVSKKKANKLYYIQVASHKSKKTALPVVRKLKRLGFLASIEKVHINNSTYHRIRIGSFADRKKALSILGRLKKTTIGKDSFIIVKRIKK